MHGIVVVLAALLTTACAQLQCKDEDNKPVDWYVMYKLPKLKSSSNVLIKSGLAYTFITSATVSKSWTLSTLSVGDPLSMPGRTLQPIYDQSKLSDLLYVLYNDEPPTGGNEELGHTKGVAISQTVGGVWLVHSVPLFPPSPVQTSNTWKQSFNNYSYPHTGTHFGQSFLCMSLNTQQMDLVGVQLTYNEPEIYAHNIPAAMEHLLPHLAAAARNTRITSAPWFHQLQLTTLAGQTFQSFAKTSHFNKELYADWVASALGANLLVESWLNGHGALPSDCKRPYTVENVASIHLDIAQVNFTTHVDHSKWAAAEDKALPWVCVGDINRMAGQEIRGGGTVCIMHPQLWASYRRAVATVDSCPAKFTATNLIP